MSFILDIMTMQGLNKFSRKTYFEQFALSSRQQQAFAFNNTLATASRLLIAHSTYVA